jgi:hypothetical protein
MFILNLIKICPVIHGFKHADSQPQTAARVFISSTSRKGHKLIHTDNKVMIVAAVATIVANDNAVTLQDSSQLLAMSHRVTTQSHCTSQWFTNTIVSILNPYLLSTAAACS